MSKPASLAGKKILVLEDEPFIATDMEEALANVGATVTLCAAATEALEIVASIPVDCGILDINVTDGTCYKVADRLRMQGTPFVFTTAYEQVRGDFADVPIFRKPFDHETLLRMVARMTAP